MKTFTVLLLTLAAFTAASGVHAQSEQVWRCGNEYTNTKPKPDQKCKLMEGGNVTVVQGTRTASTGSAGRTSGGTSSAQSPAGSPKVEGAEQRTRDESARELLSSELKKAEDRQAKLLADYNNGEPEKQGSESRNYQKYVDRVAEMKADIARNESDIAGIRRELGRLNNPR